MHIVWLRQCLVHNKYLISVIIIYSSGFQWGVTLHGTPCIYACAHTQRTWQCLEIFLVITVGMRGCATGI